MKIDDALSKKNIRELFSFGIIGVLNTLLGTSVMLGFYNLLGLNYWISSVANYVIGSIFSYFMNKRFTFKVTKKDPQYIIRFVVNIAICYLFAYGLAKRGVSYLMGQNQDMGTKVIDNVSMIVGMGLFVVLNFCGQKFFVFKRKSDGKDGKHI